MALGERAPEWKAITMMLDFFVATVGFVLGGMAAFGGRFRIAWESTTLFHPCLA